MSRQEPSVSTVYQAPQAGSPARDFKTAACPCLANPEPSWDQGPPRALHREGSGPSCGSWTTLSTALSQLLT